MPVISSARRGRFAVYNAVAGAGRRGSYRVRNDIAGYVVYVGINSLPDFTAAPATYSATLPISYTITPPGAGATDFFVTVRKRDQFGLESQNQQATKITVNSSGAFVAPKPPTPIVEGLYNRSNGGIRAIAHYPTFPTDPLPATEWRVWIDTVPNNTANPYTLNRLVTGTGALLDLGGYSAGTYYVGVALYRGSDGKLSDLVEDTIEVPAIPVQPVAVPGGFEQ
jgi:hypothetical protein